jgi:CO/xanthine dehydrogenase FAD-binding subunit
MDVFLPQTLDEALGYKADHPDAVPIAGGTDLMVELNFDRRRPARLMDLTRIPDLRQWRRDDGVMVLGAGVTYSRILRELPHVPALQMASRSVGSPQIRNRGTVGGNLGTASPAGDALPVLAAYDAEVVLVKAGGRRRVVPWDQFMVGPKRTTLAADELILEVRWPLARCVGAFSKVGVRNAMVIAIASLCLIVDEDRRRVRVALGSVGPTILRAPEAEAFAADRLAAAGAWDDPAAPLGDRAIEEFAQRVAAAARPIDDVRGTAAYRRHACEVLARRALRWALRDRASGRGAADGQAPGERR